MKTLITTTVPHRTGDLSCTRTRIRSGYSCLVDGNAAFSTADLAVANPGAMNLIVDHAAGAAVGALGSEQWMTFAKFGPTHHSQRWRFAP